MRGGRLLHGIVALTIIAVMCAIYLSSSGGVEKIRVGTLQGGVSTLDVVPMVDDRKLVSVKYFDKTLNLAQALEKGDIDVAVIPAEIVAKLDQMGGEVRIVAVDMFQNQAIVVHQESGIEELKDLVGRKVGVFTPTGTYAMFRTYMTLRRIPLDGMVLVDKPPAQLVQAFQSGEVDAIVIWEPFVSKLLCSGGRVLESFSSLGQNLTGRKPVMIVYAASNKAVREKRSALRELIKLRIEAAKFWANNRNKVVEILTKKYDLTEEEANSVYNRVDIWRGGLTKDLEENIMTVWKLAWRGGYLKKDPSNLEWAFLNP